jgi:hypothetical protein
MRRHAGAGVSMKEALAIWAITAYGLVGTIISFVDLYLGAPNIQSILSWEGFYFIASGLLHAIVAAVTGFSGWLTWRWNWRKPCPCPKRIQSVRSQCAP